MKQTYLHSIHIIKILINNPREYLLLQEIYCGAKVEQMLKDKDCISDSDIENFKLHVLKFYVELSSQIKKRFNFDHNILKFCNKLDPKVIVSIEVNSVSDVETVFPFLDVDIEKLERVLSKQMK